MGARMGVSLLVLIAGALIVITAGVVCWVVVPNVIDKKIKEETRLKPGSETWDKWETITVPIQLKFYIYNITNPGANLNAEKLVFDEIGPYVYNEERMKINADLSEAGDEVTYEQTITYFFDEEASNGLAEDDLFNIPNIPLISVATAGYATKSDGEVAALGVLLNLLTNPFLGKEKLIKEKVSVRELLFDGWKLSDYYGRLGDDLPAEFEGLKFGLYRGKNGSTDGEYVVKTGMKDHTEFGKISTWKGEPELDWWFPGDERNKTDNFCNKINGSDGSIFPPFNDKDTTLRLFNTDICRSIFMTYDSEHTFKDIPAYKYTIPMEMFEHPDTNEDNRCFCPSPSVTHNVSSECGESLIRIFPCKNNAPIVTSNARFLHGQPVLREAIELPEADPKIHETFVEIEPESGVLLQASKKIQINVELQPLNFTGTDLFRKLNFSHSTNASSLILPVFWADESVVLDDDKADDLYDKLIKPQKLVDIIKWVAIAIGALMTLGGAFGVFKAAKA